MILYIFFFFFSSRRRHTRSLRDWSSDVCSSDLRGRPDHRRDPVRRAGRHHGGSGAGHGGQRRTVTKPEDEAGGRPPGLEVVIVSGLSGAGRSTAAKCLEDIGYFVVDNLPPELIATMAELGGRASGMTLLAVVVDVRSRAFSTDLHDVIVDLDRRGYRDRKSTRLNSSHV